MKFAFRPMSSICELLFSKNASPRSLWAELRLRPVVAQELLPYIELLTKRLIPPGFAAEKERFSYLPSCVPPAKEGSRLRSAVTTSWHSRHSSQWYRHLSVI